MDSDKKNAVLGFDCFLEIISGVKCPLPIIFVTFFYMKSKPFIHNKSKNKKLKFCTLQRNNYTRGQYIYHVSHDHNHGIYKMVAQNTVTTLGVNKVTLSA